MKRKKTILILAICCLFLLVFYGYIYFTQSDRKKMSKTSSDYKLFETEESYEEELYRQMIRVYSLLKGHIQEKNVCPIPGVLSTTYSSKQKKKTSEYYVPQGLCATDDYILMTAYHNGKVGKLLLEEQKGWSSVLYVIDKKSHKFITSLGLPQAYHNGGIAFDGENVWFCGNTSPKYLKSEDPFVQCMKYERLKEIILASNDYGEIKSSDFGDKLYVDNVPSFLECDQGLLWIGSYINNDPDQNDGYIIGYPIESIKDKNPSLNRLNVRRINGIPSSSQGMDIDQDSLYISSSALGSINWIESSFISRYDIHSLENGSRFIDLEGKYISRVEVPKMNEEIIVDDKTIYLVFESSSETFLKGMPFGMKTDRIMAIDKSLWE